MNEPQKDKFLKELKDEYHGSDDQVRRQNQDKTEGKNVQKGKKTKVGSRNPATRRNPADVSSPELFRPLGSNLLCFGTNPTTS